MLPRFARRTFGLLAASLLGLIPFACSSSTPEVDNAVVTAPDSPIKPPEPSPVQPVASPSTAGAASAPSPVSTPAPTPDAAKP